MQHIVKYVKKQQHLHEHTGTSTYNEGQNKSWTKLSFKIMNIWTKSVILLKPLNAWVALSLTKNEQKTDECIPNPCLKLWNLNLLDS